MASSHRECSRGTRRTRLGVVMGFAVVVAPSLTGLAVADEPSDVDVGGCPVLAVAQGVQVVVSKSDDFFLQAPAGMATPVAQACVDYAVSESFGFASHPYPGSAVVGLPPLLRGLTQVPVPDYPAFASSSHPSPKESKQENEAYALSSRSTERSSEARAASGVSGDDAAAGSMTAAAVSEVDPRAGSSAATATSDTQPVTINGVLELGRVRSVASVTADREGRLKWDSQLTIGRTTVADQVVEITPDGVRAAGETVQLPDADPVEELEAAGVQVRYLTAAQSSRGVLSSGIEVTARQRDEQSGAVYTARYTFGRAFATAARVTEGNDGAAAPGLGVGSGEAGLEQADEVSARADDVGSGSAEVGDAPQAAEAPEPAEAPRVAQEERPRLASRPLDMGFAGLYLAIALGAVAMFGSGTLLRLLGVKTRWTS